MCPIAVLLWICGVSALASAHDISSFIVGDVVKGSGRRVTLKVDGAFKAVECLATI
jgi:hypothetical protein